MCQKISYYTAFGRWAGFEREGKIINEGAPPKIDGGAEFVFSIWRPEHFPDYINCYDLEDIPLRIYIYIFKFPEAHTYNQPFREFSGSDYKFH